MATLTSVRMNIRAALARSSSSVIGAWLTRVRAKEAHLGAEITKIDAELASLKAERVALHEEQFHRRFWRLVHALEDLASQLLRDSEDEDGAYAEAQRDIGRRLESLAARHAHPGDEP